MTAADSTHPLGLPSACGSKESFSRHSGEKTAALQFHRANLLPSEPSLSARSFVSSEGHSAAHTSTRARDSVAQFLPSQTGGEADRKFSSEHPG